ncbi:MAG: DUF4339 domain-containing protein [Candidatus Methylacidiphilales bacterium]
MSAGQQNGPVDDASLESLVVKGIIQGDTPVWRDGMADWLPLYEASPNLRGSVMGDINRSNTCSVCGKVVGAGNLVEIRDMRVCAQCKPLAVQSLKEGLTVPVNMSLNVWNDGKVVLARNAATLPSRCLKCNCEVTEKAITRKLYWHHPIIYLVLLISPVVYVIVAIISRRRASLDIYLCRRHRSVRTWAIAGGWLGSILGLVIMAGGTSIVGDTGFYVVLLGALTLLASIIAGFAFSRFASAKLIKDELVWLKGAGNAFRESLPPAP